MNKIETNGQRSDGPEPLSVITDTPTQPDQPVNCDEDTAIPPRRKRTIWIFAALAALVLAITMYWNRASLPILLELLPPYASAIAFVSLGVIRAFYNDKYRHPVAKWASVTILLVSGFLMGMNTYRERATKAQEKVERMREKAENARASAGIIKSVTKVSDELKDFKDKVRPDEIHNEMTDLRTTMEKVLHPPQAKLLFTFAPFHDSANPGGPIPVRDIALPLNQDGSVHIRFAFLNNTDVRAEELQITIDICIACKFAKEPVGFTRVPGSRETERHHLYGNMPARGAYTELAADVIPPPDIPAFSIKVAYRCKTCILEANGTTGRIRILRN